jgi:hypothetical protein
MSRPATLVSTSLTAAPICAAARPTCSSVLLRLGAVSCRSVHDLVAEHSCQFRFAVQLGQQTAVHCDLAARQCPRVRHGVVQHHEFIGQLAIRNSRELLADFVHVRSGLGEHVEVAALGLPHRRVVLLAELHFLRLRDELNFLLARDRIDAARAQRDQEQDRQEFQGMHA